MFFGHIDTKNICATTHSIECKSNPCPRQEKAHKRDDNEVRITACSLVGAVVHRWFWNGSQNLNLPRIQGRNVGQRIRGQQGPINAVVDIVLSRFKNDEDGGGFSRLNHRFR